MDGLKASELFSNLSGKDFQEVAHHFKEISHPVGHHLMTKGASGIGFMILLEGEVEVTTPEGKVSTMGPGAHFGEMALLDHLGRSADIVTKTEVRLAVLPEWGFKSFLISHPEICYRLLESMSRRMRTR